MVATGTVGPQSGQQLLGPSKTSVNTCLKRPTWVAVWGGGQNQVHLCVGGQGESCEVPQARGRVEQGEQWEGARFGMFALTVKEELKRNSGSFGPNN